MRAALRNVEELARYDSRFTEAAQQLESARATLGDVAPACATTPKASTPRPSAWPRSKTASPLLDRLKRKYGQTVAEVIAFGEDVAAKLAEVEDRDEILKALRADLEAAAKAYRKAAAALERRAQIGCRASSPNWPRRRSTRWR